VHLVSWHNRHTSRGIGDDNPFERAESRAREDIVDLDLPGMGMVADGAAGINPYMVKANAIPRISPGHQMTERNSGKLRVRVPWQGFSIDCLAICSHYFVPYG
jgi:hypothetical protein